MEERRRQDARPWGFGTPRRRPACQVPDFSLAGRGGSHL